ncbi:MAG: cytochrome c oxidase subunit 3 [Gemmatimonadota bacterium]
MSSRRMVLDVSEYPALVQGPRGGLWWGMMGLILIEVVVFTALISTYYYLKFLAPHWPPAGDPLPKLLLPTVNTVVLVGSSFAVYYADISISERGDKRGLKIGLAASLLLGVVFLALKIVEYSQVEYFWDSHAYGSIVWTMVVFHSSHVLSVVLKTSAVLALAGHGHWTRERLQGIKVNGIYWHFVVVIWLPLYFTIYWSPRIHG